MYIHICINVYIHVCVCVCVCVCIGHVRELLGTPKSKESFAGLVTAAPRKLGRSHGRVEVTLGSPISLAACAKQQKARVFKSISKVSQKYLKSISKVSQKYHGLSIVLLLGH